MSQETEIRDDVQSLMLDAWNRVWPALQKDSEELARRIARRRTPTLMRPIRAWCIAVRAADTRINPATACIVPEDAAYPHSHIVPELRCQFPYREHVVTLNTELLKRICAPVRIDPGGEEWTKVAAKLGLHPNALYYAMNRGAFRIERVPMFGGKRGRPVPVLYSPNTFDPSGRNLREPADPIWCNAWQMLADRLPADFEQTITRVPMVYGVRGRKPSFRRWLWVCPGCGKKVWMLYYPIPPITLPEFYGIDPAICDADASPKPPACFACEKCHRVRNFGRAHLDAWNTVVSYLSGGLLYGHEVRRPTWFTRDRKRAYKPRLNRAPSKRREQILDRILKGWTYRQIAIDLRIGPKVVAWYASRVFRTYGLHSRKELEARFKRVNRGRKSAHCDSFATIK